MTHLHSTWESHFVSRANGDVAVSLDMSLASLRPYLSMAHRVPSTAALRFLSHCLHAQQPFTPGPASAASGVVKSPSNARASLNQLPSRRVYGTLNTRQQQHGATAKNTQKRPAGLDAIEQNFEIDENIRARQVQLVVQGQGLNPPQSLFSLLRTIDRQKQVVRALRVPSEGPAIVEITTKDVLTRILKEREAKKAEQEKKRRELKPKQVELNWAISGNDLDLKLKQLRQFVEKGKRVEILLAAKKRQRKASPEEAENVMKEIRKTISEIEGCKELKSMEGRIGGQVVMTVGKK